MLIIIGLFIVFASVISGFLLSKGKLMSLWQPYEVLIIGGAAFGAFMTGNPLSVLWASIMNIVHMTMGWKYRRGDFMELFVLFYSFGTKIRKSGLMSIEDDIEQPLQSELFKRFHFFIKHKKALNYFNDNLRVILTGSLSSYEFENLLEKELHLYEKELFKPAKAVQSLADSLPGFGIVAAVMGIVITMQFLGGDPNILGYKVAAALVGTLLGVLLCYGFVGPLASAMNYYLNKDLAYMQCIQSYLVAVNQGSPPQLAIEYSRRSLSPDMRPSFDEVETYIKDKQPPKSDKS